MRLDSWKAIASYLGKDESTVRRWERELGLPVRRVQGAPGRSVFAYKEELDAWLTARAGQAPENAPEAQGKGDSRLRGALVLAAAAVAAAVAVGLLWRNGLNRTIAAASIEGGTLVARNDAGVERWRLALSTDERAEGLFGRSNPVEVGPGGVLAGVGLWVRRPDDRLRGGTLFEAAASGALRRQFSFDDTIQFGAGRFGPPWVLSDYRISPGAPHRIAVVAHHYEWWPSLLAVLDENPAAGGQWQRKATFVNAGWIEHIYWLSQDRFVVSGYNEALDGGVVALFDANAVGGELRANGADPKFECAACAPAAPLRYFVMPRTEVNIATGSRFNRASVDVQNTGFVVRTIEVEQDGQAPAADALYDFSPDWTLRGVTFSSRYWEVHDALQRAGKLDHDAEHCPRRHGPPVIYRWDGKWTALPMR